MNKVYIMEKVKVIAFYLPQFHSIPENDQWWGKDFTEWVNVKKAKPLFDGHEQPKRPLNDFYYDLRNDSVKIWQAELAKKYGVYGFCYYHYWFEGKMLLEKPMEEMLKNPDVDIPFCISWANASWTKEWVGDSKKVLIPQTYGGQEDWDAHYKYLRQFFKDKRYIFKDDKPLFIVYNPVEIPNCSMMLDYFNKEAIKDGFPGICFVSQMPGVFKDKTGIIEKFDYCIEFEPTHTLLKYDKNRKKVLRKIKRIIVKIFGPIATKIFHRDLQAINFQKEVRKIDYDDFYKSMLKNRPELDKSIPGAFARWDNTPRKENRGICYINNTPEKFGRYLSKQIQRCRNIYKQDMLFMYAWNEWAEGGFLEPDEQYQYKYLEEIKKALAN